MWSCGKSMKAHLYILSYFLDLELRILCTRLSLTPATLPYSVVGSRLQGLSWYMSNADTARALPTLDDDVWKRSSVTTGLVLLTNTNVTNLLKILDGESMPHGWRRKRGGSPAIIHRCCCQCITLTPTVVVAFQCIAAHVLTIVSMCVCVCVYACEYCVCVCVCVCVHTHMYTHIHAHVTFSTEPPYHWCKVYMSSFV